MNDLISRSALRHRINALAAEVVYRGASDMITGKDSCNPAEWTRGYQKGILEAIKWIDSQAAVDAVQVVRCGDCKWYKKSKRYGHYQCGNPNEGMLSRVELMPYDFCSYGERRCADAADI